MAVLDKAVTKDSLRYVLTKLENIFSKKTDIKIDSISVNGTPVQPDSNKNVDIQTSGTYELPVATSTTLGGIKVGNNLSIENGSLSAIVPTDNSQLQNGAGYQTASDVAAAITTSSKLTKEIVDELPSTGVDNVLYLVPKSKTETNNGFDEYLWINNSWEFMGSSEMDLSGYVKTTDISEITNEDIDELFADM